MDASDIRIANLRALIQRFGGQAHLGRAIGTDPSYISQIINRVPLPSGKPRNVGDDFARKIEQALELPHGWMDTPHHPDQAGASMAAEPPAVYELVTAQERALLDRFRKTDDRGKKTIAQVAETQSVIDQPQPGLDEDERKAG